MGEGMIDEDILFWKKFGIPWNFQVISRYFFFLSLLFIVPDKKKIEPRKSCAIVLHSLQILRQNNKAPENSRKFSLFTTENWTSF